MNRGAQGIFFGLWFIIAPYQLASVFGYGEMTGPGVYFMALAGVGFVAGSVFIIWAARDPLRHIMWVKLAILWSLLGLVVESYSIVRGDADFSQAGIGVISWAVFAVAFLAFYPWRAARGSE